MRPFQGKPRRFEQAYAAVAGELLKQVKAGWTDQTLTIEDDMYGEKWARGQSTRVLIDHQTHHRGQMTVLMRQAGLKVPGVYGPSKEEWAGYRRSCLRRFKENATDSTDFTDFCNSF